MTQLAARVALLSAVLLASGCRYGASFDDCDVRSCRGPADCPTGMTCDPDSYCRVPGASAPCAFVIGDGRLPIDGPISGDAVDAIDASGPRCTGSATPCTQLADRTSCLEQIGCAWANPTCTVITNCGMFLTNQQCSAHPECVTDFATSTCVKRPSHCQGSTEPTCEDVAVCQFAGGCSGVVEACDRFGTAAGCDAQGGCAWGP